MLSFEIQHCIRNAFSFVTLRNTYNRKAFNTQQDQKRPTYVFLRRYFSIEDDGFVFVIVIEMLFCGHSGKLFITLVIRSAAGRGLCDQIIPDPVWPRGRPSFLQRMTTVNQFRHNLRLAEIDGFPFKWIMVGLKWLVPCYLG